ncbi:PAAR domain-containing protein [Paraburkholderia sp. 22B1P]
MGVKSSRDFPFFQIDGRPAAGVGHAVTCPKCSGRHYIVGGVDSFSIRGVAVAIHGMKTSCGATLIASQSNHMLEHTSGAVGEATGGFGADNLPEHISSDDDLEQIFIFKHTDTGEPVRGMAYKLISNGSSLGDVAQLTGGSTEALSLTDYPNLQLVAWRT